MKLAIKQINPLLILFVALISLLAGCSHHQKASKTDANRSEANISSDRSNQINYTKPLSFLNDQGDTLATIKVAVAKSSKERNEGLMDVDHMADNRGMLFIFDHQQKLSFWMANTPLSLDIIFVNKQKQIVRIHQSTQPFSQKNLPSGKPAIYAVETNGGFCVNHDIREGMQIVFRNAN
jgi:uncharacterized membrane protein (UPF0127 family)